MSASAGPSQREFIRLQLTQVMLETVVYGSYAVLFGMTMYIIARSKSTSIHRTRANRYDIGVLVSLFVIGTIVILCDLLGSAGSFYNSFRLGGIVASMTSAEARKFDHGMIVVTQTGYIFTNILVDFILICRCYNIWNSSVKIIAGPVIVSVLNNILGIAIIPTLFMLQFDKMPTPKLLNLVNHANNMLTAFMAINVINNVLLTSLIGGRIAWIMRQAEKASSSSMEASTIRKHYISIIALILETGLLYPVTVIVFEIITHTVSVSPSLYPLMTLMAGITPTLIIVRVQLGVSINSVDETLATEKLISGTDLLAIVLLEYQLGYRFIHELLLLLPPDLEKTFSR